MKLQFLHYTFKTQTKNYKYLLIVLLGIFFLTPQILHAKGDKKNKNHLSKISTVNSKTYLDINNIVTFFYNDGTSDITPNRNSGFVYPKGTVKTAVFTSGLLWGAKIAGDTVARVGGSTYATGLAPGNINVDGTAADSTLDKFRIYRVRTDIHPGGPTVDLFAESILEGITEFALRTNYIVDWTQWPAELGAPYDDKNNNGIYELLIDVPGVPGADQTIWFVANDLDTNKTKNLYGSNPMGIELQETIWAYNRADALGNMLFRKFILINKTNLPALTPTIFDSMYISFWMDADVGEAGDDYVGVDTLLNLQYSYNSQPNDNVYSSTPSLPPPAVGFTLLQGPLVDGISGQDLNKNGVDDAVDSGIFFGKSSGPGKINLPFTTSYYHQDGVVNFTDPPLHNIEGSRQFYNFFQGKWGISGEKFIDPTTGLTTNFVLAGDPVTGQGWIDGIQLPPADRRCGSASGPFTMAPGDTQEVVIAVIVAGAHSGSDYLSAITELKSFASVAKSQFLLTDINDIKNQIPKSFKLEQNYPNPFNPTTTISYLIPKASFVTLTIYDVLGKEVKTLVNKFQSVGKYNVTFNASNLSSGVYIYSIKAGNFSVSKKLVLMK